MAKKDETKKEEEARLEAERDAESKIDTIGESAETKAKRAAEEIRRRLLENQVKEK